MATYAIGDIQGCYTVLQRLLRRLRFDPAVDRLWLCGDLVNRGPQSLEVLRWAKGLGDRVRIVLGNHDLKLLAVAYGQATQGGRDTLQPVLDADDRAELLDWLIAQPLLQIDRDYWMVHAALLPAWDLDAAAAAAKAAQTYMRADPVAFFSAYSRHRQSLLTPPGPAAEERAIYAAKVLTTLRVCRPPGDLLLGYSGPPQNAPQGFAPWFRWPHARPLRPTLVCGHWSALGLYRGDGIVALDSGCVWGRTLTAFHLETGETIGELASDLSGPSAKP